MSLLLRTGFKIIALGLQAKLVQDLYTEIVPEDKRERIADGVKKATGVVTDATVAAAEKVRDVALEFAAKATAEQPEETPVEAKPAVKKAAPRKKAAPAAKK